jgi:hypothetical protein
MKIERGLLEAILLSSVVGGLAACPQTSDPIRGTLNHVAKAAHDRDARAVAAELSDDYRDTAGNGRAEAEQMLRGYFAAYEVVDVSLGEITVERSEAAARVRFRADLSGQPRKAAGLAGLLPSSSRYLFDVRLTGGGSRWKIAWASWEPAGP